MRVVRVGKVLRMLQVYRLLRVTRLPRLLERIETFMDKGILQVGAGVAMHARTPCEHARIPCEHACHACMDPHLGQAHLSGRRRALWLLLAMCDTILCPFLPSLHGCLNGCACGTLPFGLLPTNHMLLPCPNPIWPSKCLSCPS